MPARSNASQEVSSSSRCCGSMASASRGRCRRTRRRSRRRRRGSRPRRAYVLPALSGSGSYSSSRSQPRSVGNVRDRVAAARRPGRHRSSGEATPPGKRQAMPTIAIGSSSAGLATATVTVAAPACVPASSATQLIAPPPVGSGSRRRAWRAAAARSSRSSRLRSSTAVSESKPRSRNARSAGDLRRGAVPQHHGRDFSRTRSSTVRARSAGSSPANRAASRRRRADRRTRTASAARPPAPDAGPAPAAAPAPHPNAARNAAASSRNGTNVACPADPNAASNSARPSPPTTPADPAAASAPGPPRDNHRLMPPSRHPTAPRPATSPAAPAPAGAPPTPSRNAFAAA